MRLLFFVKSVKRRFFFSCVLKMKLLVKMLTDYNSTCSPLSVCSLIISVIMQHKIAVMGHSHQEFTRTSTLLSFTIPLCVSVFCCTGAPKIKVWSNLYLFLSVENALYLEREMLEKKKKTQNSSFVIKA